MLFCVVYWMCIVVLFRLSFLFVFSYIDYHMTYRLMQLADSPYPTHVAFYPLPEIYVLLMTYDEIYPELYLKIQFLTAQ